MRIPSRGRGEEGKQQWTLVPENVDDLWHLSHVLEPGDHVGGDTTRRIQRNDENLRDTGGQREHLVVTIQVEDVEFARFANRLRVGVKLLVVLVRMNLDIITRSMSSLMMRSS